MSSVNIMTEVVVKRLGVKVKRDESKRITLTNACGEVFRSEGEGRAWVSFPGESPQKRKFTIARTCAVSVIMGDPFLRITETLTKFRHRLKKAVSSSLKKAWRLCYLGAPHQQLACFLDGEHALAKADTGSDMDLVSLAYANKRRWAIHPIAPDRDSIELADRSKERLAGYVEKQLSIGRHSSTKIFYVLQDLVCDALLGDETLHELDAFNKYAPHFVDEINELVEHDHCHNINWVKEKKNRTEQILDGVYPSALPSMNSGGEPLQQPNSKSSFWKRHIRTPTTNKYSTRDMEAWNAAFHDALETLNSVELKARDKAEQEMRLLSSDDLVRATTASEARQQRYADRIKAIKLARDTYFGTAASP